MLKKFLCGTASIVALGAITGPSALAQEDDVIVVTGSYIAGTPEDAALPVDVFSQTELERVGAPTLNELLRNIGATQGLIGETNQFDTRGGQGNEGVTTINLRGLGSARTLVLINGRRHVGANAEGVDVSMIPSTAIQRLEILKDGAAALYGSDAIGGVVNFITRDGFEGFEARASHQFIEDSDGESLIGGIFGHSGDNYDFFVAAEYGHRSELRVRDRDFALRPFLENRQGGWSSIGNPATFIHPDFIPVAQSIGQAPVIFGQADPNCNDLGGFLTPIASTGGTICRFQFTFFDNLIEEQDDVRVFSRGTFAFGDQELALEAAYAEVDVPEYATSPAYPPQSLNDTRVPVTHPGLIDFFADNPTFAATLGAPGPTDDYVFWGRYTGVGGVRGGQPETNQRLTEQYRLAATLSGDLFDGGLSYDLGVTYSRRDRELNGYRDMVVQNFAFALQGLGGPNCTPSTGTPGAGPCEYFNPFSSAIERSATTGQANPNFDPAFANSPELLDWLVEEGFALARNDLTVTDLIVSGDTNWELPGGVVGFAAGAQARYEVFEQDISDNFNLSLNPCPFDDPFAVTLGLTDSLDCDGTPGRFGFLSGTTPSRTERTVYGGFVELALPFSDTFDVQLAARFEDYGGQTGSTFDPKVAARWQVTPDLTLRGSASSTFRGPPQPFLTGRNTVLTFTAPTNAFKAHDILGNPDLAPESAIAANLGAVFQRGPVTASVDYWRFDFSDPIQIEDGNQILNAYIAADCADGGTGVGSAECTALRSHIFPLGVAGPGVERIERNYINGSDITTDGVDFHARFDGSAQSFDYGFGVEGTYTLSYESDDFVDINGVTLADGGDFVGFYNFGTPFQSLVELQGSLFANVSTGPHYLSYALRYKDGYTDQRPTLATDPVNGIVPDLVDIDSFTTHDITYNLELFDGATRLSASVFNLTDEEPPRAATDLNYDAYQHSAFGRLFKIGVTQTFN